MHRTANHIKNRKIRFAIVGCGRIAKNHLEAIQNLSNEAELVGVCDIDVAACNKMALPINTKIYHNLEELLVDTNADVISLTTPSGLHPHQAIKIAHSGRHVITEKPMATKWQDGLNMVKVCRDANIYLFVVKQNRLNPTIQALKNTINIGRFGKIYMATANVFWTRPQDYYDSAAWRGTWEYDGGAFMNQASHYIDLLGWLIGPVESVHAYTATLARNIETEDTGVMNLKWRSGALGSINVTMLTYPKNLEGSITIIGEHGTVILGGVALNEIHHWEFATKDPKDLDVNQLNYSPNNIYGFGHKLYYENVIKVLRGEATPSTDGYDGLKSLELLIAAYRSARDGARVALPLEL